MRAKKMQRSYVTFQDFEITARLFYFKQKYNMLMFCAKLNFGKLVFSDF